MHRNVCYEIGIHFHSVSAIILWWEIFTVAATIILNYVDPTIANEHLNSIAIESSVLFWYELNCFLYYFNWNLNLILTTKEEKKPPRSAVTNRFYYVNTLANEGNTVCQERRKKKETRKANATHTIFNVCVPSCGKFCGQRFLALINANMCACVSARQCACSRRFPLSMDFRACVTPSNSICVENAFGHGMGDVYRKRASG